MTFGANSSSRRFGWVAALALLLVAPPTWAADLKLEAQLIWGTNDTKSPDPTHKAVDPDTQKKLKSLPFKWASYFEVNRQRFAVSGNATKKLSMSKECEILVRNCGTGSVEVTLFGKGERVGKITQALPKGELLVTGGNAANFTAWFVVLRQTD